jgi:carbamoyl-phosphate synthase large subunit
LRADCDFRGKIVGLAYDALDTGIYDPSVLDEVYMIPYPQEGEGNLLEHLRYLKVRAGLDVVIPNLDSELLNFCRIRDELKEIDIATLLPSRAMLELRSKVKLSEFCAREGFASPATEIIHDSGYISEACSRLGFPSVLKAIFYGAHVCRSLEEVHVYHNRLRDQWGLPLVLQAFIHGEEYNVCGLGSPEGSPVGAVAMRKMGITDKGKAWAGVTVRNDDLLRLTTAVMERLKWTGPLEIEVIREHQSKTFYILEINPRFPAWVYLTAAAGQNLPRAAVRMALGDGSGDLSGYTAGMTFVRHATDIVCPLNYLESLCTKGELVYSEAGAPCSEARPICGGAEAPKNEACAPCSNPAP